jgi:uncharacterized C2H2 Zn-finger protein
LETLEKALTQARDVSESVLRCPGCQSVVIASNDFEVRKNDCFLCTCTGCNTEWGLRICSSGHRYPVMLPSGTFRKPSDTEPGWEDRSYGCDILALPKKTNKGEWGFACPECGEIS